MESNRNKRGVKETESALNSDVVNKILKYCPKDIKNKIIDQKIIYRYKGDGGNDEDYE